MVDITKHFSSLKLNLQGENKIIRAINYYVNYIDRGALILYIKGHEAEPLLLNPSLNMTPDLVAYL